MSLWWEPGKNQSMGKSRGCPILEAPLPHYSQAERIKATLENKVDLGLGQAQGGEDSHCHPQGGSLPHSPPYNCFLCSWSSASLRVPSSKSPDKGHH